VHDDVEPAGAGDRIGDQRRRGSGIAKIRGKDVSVSTRRADIGRDQIQRAFISRAKNRRRAVVSEALREALADTSTRARANCDFAMKRLRHDQSVSTPPPRYGAVIGAIITSMRSRSLGCWLLLLAGVAPAAAQTPPSREPSPPTIDVIVDVAATQVE